jgi:uncharacterized membrane protein YphA (DoxX/SURF4 family)
VTTENLASNPFASADFVIRIAAALIFVSAAVPKVRDPAGFMAGINKYELLSVSQARLVAYFLPWLELGLGVWIAFGWLTKASTVLAAFLLVAFGVVVGRSLRRGQRFLCNCFGAGQGEYIGTSLLVRNVVLATLLTFVAVTDSGSWPPFVTWGNAGDFVATAAAVTFTLLFIFFLRYWDVAFRGDMPSRKGAVTGRAK